MACPAAEEWCRSICYYALHRERRASAGSQISSPAPVALATGEATSDSHYHADIWRLAGSSVKAIMKSFRSDGAKVKAWLDQLPYAELLALSQRASLARAGGGGGEGSSVLVSEEEAEGLSEACRLEADHLELQRSEGSLGWCRLWNGSLAIQGAPGKSKAKDWAREGATCVVTLLREAEPLMQPSCAGVLSAGLRLEHAPLSGKSAVTSPDELDRATWQKLDELMPALLKEGERVVVHCAAGMHRTGSVAFRACRLSGLSPEETLLAVEKMRPVTHEALLHPEKDGRPLWTVAEKVLAALER